MLDNAAIAKAFAPLSTPNIADACVRHSLPMSIAPPSLRALVQGMRCSGRALPVTHFGSVDVFFEALDQSSPGDVMVIDNEDRRDEACIGDLAVLEMKFFKLNGVLVWGAHRDSADLIQIGFPVFSTGTTPPGPRSARQRLRQPLESCTVGGTTITRDDYVFADEDGILFIPATAVAAALDGATKIRETEARQADNVRAGMSLHQQFDWDRYLEGRRKNPAYGLREHLQTLSAAIEV